MPTTMGHTGTGQVFMHKECQQLSTAVKKRGWGQKRGNREEGAERGRNYRQVVAPGCLPKQRKRGKENKIRTDKDPSLTFKRYESKREEGDRQRDSEEQQL